MERLLITIYSKLKFILITVFLITGISGVYAQLVPGTVSGDQTICYNTAPVEITANAPNGGTTPYTYQWESSIDGSTWLNVDGATDLIFQPANLLETTYYHQLQSDAAAGTVTTATITITVYSEFLPGIAFGDQIICYNTTPTLLLFANEPTGGDIDGNYTYQWEKAEGVNPWEIIPGATSLSYSETNQLVTTTRYRLAQKSDCEIDYTYTNNIIVTVKDPITVTIVPNMDTVCINEEVAFSGFQNGVIVPIWNWDFDDNTSNSPDQNPLHSFVNAGDYDVSLTVTDDIECSSTSTYTIHVVNPPVVDFTYFVSECQTIHFDDASIPPTGYSIVSWEWVLDDGTATSNLPAFDYTYTSSGTKSVQLIVVAENQYGSTCTNSVTLPVIVPENPTADFDWLPVPGLVNEEIIFTGTSGSGTVIGDNDWIWSFGDNSGGVGQSIGHTYNATSNPSYEVTLTVTDDNLCIGQIIKDVFVLSIPEVDFTWDAGCMESETFFFVDQNVTNIAEVAQYIWDFGDGGFSSAQDPTHVYVTSGSFTVTLTIIDIYGVSNSIEHQIDIIPLPTSFFSVETPNCEGAETHVTDYSTTTSGFIETWEWDFGDGIPIDPVVFPDNPDLSHIYASAGTYSIKLIVTTNEGCSNTYSEDVIITSSPIALFSYESACLNDPVSFADESTTNGGGQIIDWQWNFGDPGSDINNTSELQNPNHIFSEPETYEVSLIVGSATGCSDTIVVSNVIVNPLPDVTIEIIDDIICLGEIAEFEGNSNSVINTWSWDFGDGEGSSLEQNPTYTYTTSGLFQVTLTVTEVGSTQCQNFVLDTIYVNDAPEADFNYENTCFGDSTYFTDLSTSQYGTIVEWLWGFGDPDSGPSNVSTIDNPAHYFTNNDQYQVILISTDNNGCTDTVTQIIQVFSKPIAGFSFHQACQPSGHVDFINEMEPGEDGSPIIEWNWQLDNGYFSTELNPSYIYPETDSCYTVMLEVTDENGCISADTNEQVCLHGTIEVDFTFTEECIGTSTFFQASYGPENDSVESYTWNFNDGSPFEITYHDTVMHTFPNSGLYMVDLIALDTNGCSTTISHYVNINQLPAPQFIYDAGSCDTPTQFTDISLGAGEFIKYWHWDFGDVSSGTNDTSSLENPTHLYGPIDSTYQVKLIVTNFNCCVDSIVQDVYIGPCLIADFILPTEPTCARYDNTCFVDISELSSTNGNISEWSWDFGDGNMYNYNTQQDSICHNYDRGGSYQVELTVVATINGITYNATTTKELVVYETPEAGIQVQNNCFGDSTMFYDASNPNSEPITQWQWDFDDPDSGTENTSSLQNPVHKFNQYDSYSTQLLVINQYGCEDSIVQDVVVFRPPDAEFSFEETCMSYKTYFTDLSIGDSSDIEQYFWAFGVPLTIADTSNVQDPEYIFDLDGIYDVELTIIDGNQCFDTVSHAVEIYPIPISDFIIIDSIPEGMVYLENTSINATSYYWDFDFDYGISTTEENPMHQYEEDGPYNIMLISYNEYGCPDTTYQMYDLLFTHLFVPNAFMPSNSDPELNTFKPIGINIKSYQLEVYSPWGNLVFQSSRLNLEGAPAEGWDGTYKGEPMPTGSFIWRISAVFKNDEYWKGSDNGDGNTGTSGTLLLIR